jgi:hypothetical protein
MHCSTRRLDGYRCRLIHRPNTFTVLFHVWGFWFGVPRLSWVPLPPPLAWVSGGAWRGSLGRLGIARFGSRNLAPRERLGIARFGSRNLAPRERLGIARFGSRYPAPGERLRNILYKV